jgi:MbtH protein
MYIALQNYEEQYSLWLKCSEIPVCWKAIGKHGLKSECLEYIKIVWKDMVSLSLWRSMIKDQNFSGNLK